MYCIHCGERIAKNSARCPKCGKAIKPSLNAIFSFISGKKKLLIIIGIAGILIASPFLFATAYNAFLLKKGENTQNSKGANSPMNKPTAAVIYSPTGENEDIDSQELAVTVNGQKILRVTVINEAKKARLSEKEQLNALVRNLLVEQQAQKEQITVSAVEIDAEMKKIEESLLKQDQNLSQVLEQQGTTKEDFRKSIRLDLLVTKMVEKDVKVSDKEVSDYIEKNRDIMPKDQSETQLKKTVAERLKQQQLSQKAQVWLENIKQNSNIKYYVNY